jgi:hypothetical protein
MKFTIERKTLIRMLDQTLMRSPVGWNSGLKRARRAGVADQIQMKREKRKRQRRNLPVKLSACAARVFVETKTGTAGHETLVLEDGECVVPGVLFASLLETFEGQSILTVEANGAGLRIGKFSMGVLRYSPAATPPGEFQVFPVTDLGVAVSQSEVSA